MYADLGVCVTTPFDAKKCAPLLEAAQRLGYGVVALNETVEGPLKVGKHLCKQSSISNTGTAGPIDIIAALSARPGTGLSRGRKRRRTEDPDRSSSSSSSGAAPGLFPPHQLSRITVVLPPLQTEGGGKLSKAAADVGAYLSLESPVLNSYDLVAALPADAEGLRRILSVAEAVDIVSLDLSGGRPPVPLTPEILRPVLAAGLVLEVAYAPAIRDATFRRFFIANTVALLRATRGKGVLLTSGALTALELRGPGDAAALAALAGLNEAQAREAMRDTAAAVCAHAVRRRGLHGQQLASSAAAATAATVAAAASSASLRQQPPQQAHTQSSSALAAKQKAADAAPAVPVVLVSGGGGGGNQRGGTLARPMLRGWDPAQLPTAARR